jgi:hypothetical protein
MELLPDERRDIPVSITPTTSMPAGRSIGRLSPNVREHFIRFHRKRSGGIHASAYHFVMSTI